MRSRRTRNSRFFIAARSDRRCTCRGASRSSFKVYGVHGKKYRPRYVRRLWDPKVDVPWRIALTRYVGNGLVLNDKTVTDVDLCRYVCSFSNVCIKIGCDNEGTIMILRRKSAHGCNCPCHQHCSTKCAGLAHAVFYSLLSELTRRELMLTLKLDSRWKRVKLIVKQAYRCCPFLQVRCIYKQMIDL